jgi:hypothetical protein
LLAIRQSSIVARSGGFPDRSDPSTREVEP